MKCKFLQKEFFVNFKNFQLYNFSPQSELHSRKLGSYPNLNSFQVFFGLNLNSGYKLIAEPWTLDASYVQVRRHFNSQSSFFKQDCFPSAPMKKSFTIN